MDGNDFELKKEGSTLQVYLGFELSIDNSAELRKMLSDYRGQDISKIVFDATDLVFISSSGIRAIIYAGQEIGHQPKIEFVNCAQEIYDSFKITGLRVLLKMSAKLVARAVEMKRTKNGIKNSMKPARNNSTTMLPITMWCAIR